VSSNIYKPSPADIKALRERSGAGMLDVRNALVEANGDAEAAFKALREAGIAKAAKLAGRETSEGRIGAYIHPGGQKGVLVEIRCNTDFVANSEPVEAFVKDMCLQIVSSDNTRWIRIDDVPEEARQAELEVFRAEAQNAGRPADKLDQIAEGRLRKWYEEVVLLEQPYFRDEKLKVEEVRAALARETGENVEIARFASYTVGRS
jgi:elongation factor Ts